MEYDKTKIDDDVLALLFLTAFRERSEFPFRAWKGHDFDTMSRLHEAGWIADPVSKAKSVAFSDEGYARAENLFWERYGIPDED